MGVTVLEVRLDARSDRVVVMADEGTSPGLLVARYGSIVPVVPGRRRRQAARRQHAADPAAVAGGRRTGPSRRRRRAFAAPTGLRRVCGRRPWLRCPHGAADPSAGTDEPIEALAPHRASCSSGRVRAATASTPSARPIEAITLIPDDELRERVEAGTLKQIKGIGDSSAAIIGQAVRGVMPAYLASAEEKHGAAAHQRRRRAVCRPPR